MRGLTAAGVALVMILGAGQAVACSQPSDVQTMVNDMASGLNQTRQQNGARAIAANAQLSQAAQAQACDVARTGNYSHRGSDGSDVSARVRRAGYGSCLTAENLAWGFRRAPQVIAGWMTSQGHRANMLNGRASEFGIGVAQGSDGPVWVLVLARGC